VLDSVGFGIRHIPSLWCCRYGTVIARVHLVHVMNTEQCTRHSLVSVHGSIITTFVVLEIPVSTSRHLETHFQSLVPDYEASGLALGLHAKSF